MQLFGFVNSVMIERTNFPAFCVQSKHNFEGGDGMKKCIAVFVLWRLLVSTLACSAETEPVSGGDPARLYTFEELTGLSREKIDHIVIRSGSDGSGYSTAYGKILTDIYNTINTKSFTPCVSQENSGGWKYQILFFDENNDGCTYSISKGIYPEGHGGLAYRTTEEEKLETVVEAAYALIANDCSNWASDYIAQAKDIGLLQDMEAISYKENISRENFCEMVYNLIDITTDIQWKKVSPNPFEDTDNEKVIALRLERIIFGKEVRQFAPQDFLTREEAATIIVRMINAVMPMAATEMYFEYDDNHAVSDWAADSVQTISNLGFMNGVGGNLFAPKENYTAEQAITALVRIYNYNKALDTAA